MKGKRNEEGNIQLELDETEAWFLTQILDNSLDNYELFTTVDDDDDETFDEDFHSEVKSIRDKLLTIRLGE
jgi:hypothetical protein